MRFAKFFSRRVQKIERIMIQNGDASMTVIFQVFLFWLAAQAKLNVYEKILNKHSSDGL